MIILNVSKQLQHWFLLKEKKSDINFYDDVLGKKTHPVDGGGGGVGSPKLNIPHAKKTCINKYSWTERAVLKGQSNEIFDL